MSSRLRVAIAYLNMLTIGTEAGGSAPLPYHLASCPRTGSSTPAGACRIRRVPRPPSPSTRYRDDRDPSTVGDADVGIIGEVAYTRAIMNARSDAGDAVFQTLDAFRIELPSWGFANTGTRFGKYLQPAAAVTIEEKLRDAGARARADRLCPTVALHVHWDFPGGLDDAEAVAAMAARAGVAPARSTRTSSRTRTTSTARSAIRIRPCARRRSSTAATASRSRRVGSRDLSLLVRRRLELSGHGEHPAAQALVRGGADAPCTTRSATEQRLLVEYKPFEPAFYHTDIADWGMALLLARAAGRRRRCSSTPAITTCRRTSSRSSPGCSTKACSAASTSTIAGMPTTT